jgi:hypothetical protein
MKQFGNITLAPCPDPTIEIRYNGKRVGEINTDYEFLQLRTQIVETQAVGYSFVHDGREYSIAINGQVEIDPFGAIADLHYRFLQAKKRYYDSK